MTVDNVAQVLNMIGANKWNLICALSIPKTQQEEIQMRYFTDTEKIHASASYYVNYHPDASWKRLTGELYYKREFSAAMKSKSYMLTGICNAVNTNCALAHNINIEAFQL